MRDIEKKQIKAFPFSFKISEDDEGIIRGYASTFGNVDTGGDVVMRGAFKDTIAANDGKFPILADHDSRKQIGINLNAREDEVGLYVEGRLDIENNQTARERYSMAKIAIENGMKVGLSIGYRIESYSTEIIEDDDGSRREIWKLERLSLSEYSIVTFPMNQAATVVDVKSSLSSNALLSAIDALEEKIIKKILTDRATGLSL